jgi:myo-inositol-1(or 4)-monophosphatase
MDSRLLQTAIDASRLGGEILLENLNRLAPLVAEVKGAFDYVTEVDRQSEQAIVDLIRERFPGHSFLAEESGTSSHEADYRWIIDPLDGTTNYIHGFPVFAVSVAVERRGEIVAAAVHDPMRQETFSAEAGKGSFLNEQRISVSRTAEISRCLVGTGFPFRTKHLIEPYLAVFRKVFAMASDVRRAGSASLDLAWLAAGRLDGFWELNLSYWDIAAGMLLIREAGGKVSDLAGGPIDVTKGNIVASNGLIHQWLVDTVWSVFREV